MYQVPFALLHSSYSWLIGKAWAVAAVSPAIPGMAIAADSAAAAAARFRTARFLMMISFG
jgi:hypothetical protein